MSDQRTARFVGGVLDGEQIVFTSSAWPDSVSFGGDDYDLRREGDELLYVCAEASPKDEERAV